MYDAFGTKAIAMTPGKHLREVRAVLSTCMTDIFLGFQGSSHKAVALSQRLL
jgi:hypothetical protein